MTVLDFCEDSRTSVRMPLLLAGVMKLVNIADLKSAAARLTGSSPVPGTTAKSNTYLNNTRYKRVSGMAFFAIAWRFASLGRSVCNYFCAPHS